jgi:ribonuclease E
MAAPPREESHSRDADLDHTSADERPAARGDDFDDEPRSADRDSAEPALDEDGRPRRRRRRRGRRGGRRGAASGERSIDQGGEGAPPQTSSDRAARDLDHEPLPSGYGRGQTPRQSESRESAPRTESGERRGRRRRRGRGDEPSRRPAAEGSGESARRRSRPGRRSADSERTSSSSSLARRSRDDFAPVARGYDEDDEGLEFLGLEESGHEQPRREDRHVEDDDVLVESGLNAVRDVPSWVEAIGIVIAGNLDARSRPRADRDDDRRRR